jgi:hypothetical protein
MSMEVSMFNMFYAVDNEFWLTFVLKAFRKIWTWNIFREFRPAVLHMHCLWDVRCLFCDELIIPPRSPADSPRATNCSETESSMGAAKAWIGLWSQRKRKRCLLMVHTVSKQAHIILEGVIVAYVKRYPKVYFPGKVYENHVTPDAWLQVCLHASLVLLSGERKTPDAKQNFYAEV